MSPRKSLRIADTPELPTIKDYFGMMAEEQRDDIRRLKRAVSGKKSEQAAKPLTSKAVPNPWLLHPIRLAKGSTAKPSGKRPARSAAKKAPKKATRKAAKKVAKKRRG
jgi:hypothetical protein